MTHLKIIFLSLFFLYACVETKKQKPNLDAFFEKINEEKESGTVVVEGKKPLKIAVILPMSGIYSKIGTESYEAIRIARSKLGENIEIKVFDTGGKKENIPFIKEKIEEEGFGIIVGPVFNFETAVLADLEKKVPIISLSNDSSIKRSNVITFGLNQEEKIIDSVAFFTSKDRKNFAAIFPNSASGSRNYKVFKSAVDENEGNIMRTEFYDESGISNVSNYVSKIVNGIKQIHYVSPSGSVITERQMKDLKQKNPNLDESEYVIQESEVNIIFISASGGYLKQIIEILNKPQNRQKLQNVSIFFADVDLNSYVELGIWNNESQDKRFFYTNFSKDLEDFYSEYKQRTNNTPTRIATLLYDAILYSVFVNEKSFGTLNASDIKSKYAGFVGLNGSFYITQDNIVRRNGKIMLVKEGTPIEMEFNEEARKKPIKSFKVFSKTSPQSDTEINEDLD